MYLFIFRFSLVLKVFFDYLLIGILPYRIYVIPTCPEFAAPKHLLYLGMKPENLLCCNALDRPYYLFWSIRGNALYQKMNMVPIKADLQKIDLVSLFYPKTDLPESRCNIIRQNLSPVFDRTNKMIKQQALVMTFVNMITHTHKNTYHYATPEAEPRGIL